MKPRTKRAGSKANQAGASKAASVGGLFHGPSKFQITASAAINSMHMMTRRPMRFMSVSSGAAEVFWPQPSVNPLSAAERPSLSECFAYPRAL
jgi:hypothetical protein